MYDISIRNLKAFVEAHSDGDKAARLKEVATNIANLTWESLRQKVSNNYEAKIAVSEQGLSWLAANERYGAVGFRNLLSQLLPGIPRMYRAQYEGNAGHREIEVVEWGEDRIRPQDTPVDRFVSVFVDDVRFYQHDAAGQRQVAKGKYIRIKTRSEKEGAIVLPVDIASGQVLLVTQFRHPQRKFITEAPRGFALFTDRTTDETAGRELREETGASAVSLIHLRSLWTDTGMLEEKPAYYLALINKDDVDASSRRAEPLMENPVWVPLKKFYEAVWNGSTRLNDSDAERYRSFDEAFPPHARERQLTIEDAFTFAIAALALPQLMAQFPNAHSELLPRPMRP